MIYRCAYERERWRAKGDLGKHSQQLENDPGSLHPWTSAQHAVLDAGKNYLTAIERVKEDHRIPGTYDCNRSMFCRLHGE